MNPGRDRGHGPGEGTAFFHFPIPPNTMKQPLKLTVRALRSLQSKHGIANLLKATAEDEAKMANLDFLVDIYFEGSRKWDPAPTMEQVEDIEIGELSDAVKSVFNGQPTEGNG